MTTIVKTVEGVDINLRETTGEKRAWSKIALTPIFGAILSYLTVIVISGGGIYP